MIKFLVSFTAIFIMLFAGCDKKPEENTPSDNNGEIKKELELTDSSILNLPEPSGLAFSTDRKYLWTVSDHTGKAYLLSLEGDIIKDLDLGGTDLEGIVSIDTNVIGVVYEKEREVVIVDTTGLELHRKSYDISSEYNLGFEGITYSRKRHRYYIVNEKSPMLLVELDDELNETNRFELNFSTDLSGICYDEVENVFWILSHESRLLGKFDEKFNLIEIYDVPLEQAEGVAVDSQNGLIYMVSDVDNMFAVFRIK